MCLPEGNCANYIIIYLFHGVPFVYICAIYLYMEIFRIQLLIYPMNRVYSWVLPAQQQLGVVFALQVALYEV